MQLTGVLFLMDHCRQSLRPKLVFGASKNRPPYSGNYDALRFLPRAGLDDCCGANGLF
jgi:hypothetical protein